VEDEAKLQLPLMALKAGSYEVRDSVGEVTLGRLEAR
jgi:hypothetical protein